jgi:hypothetical protein
MAKLNLNSLFHQLIDGNQDNIVRIDVALQKLFKEMNLSISLFIMCSHNQLI